MKETDKKVKEVCGKMGGIDESGARVDRVMEELGRKVDKVCGKVGGIDESGARVDRQLEKTARVMDELGRKVDKVCDKVGGVDESRHYDEHFFDNVKRMQEETARQMKETDKKVKEVCGKMGGIDENLGHHAEQFFQDVFRRKMEFGGIKYKRIHPNFIGESDNKEKIEFDIALFNGESVALIEVKNRIHPNFVTEFAQERVRKFRELCPEYKSYKLYLGIAGFSFDKKVMEEAKENGIGIVKQAGEGIEVEAENLKAY
jgi:hypothetical protein